jgi:hypothetical protein
MLHLSLNEALTTKFVLFKAVTMPDQPTWSLDDPRQTPTAQPTPIAAPACAFTFSRCIIPLIIDLFFVFVGMITTDGGGGFKIFLSGFIAHSVGIAIIAMRRPDRLTSGDRLFIRYGFFLLSFFLEPLFLAFWLDYVPHHHWCHWIYRL